LSPRQTGGNTQETQTQTDPGPLNDQETEGGQWFPNVAGIPYMGHMWE